MTESQCQVCAAATLHCQDELYDNNRLRYCECMNFALIQPFPMWVEAV